jgi:hypothetical protein
MVYFLHCLPPIRYNFEARKKSFRCTYRPRMLSAGVLIPMTVFEPLKSVIERVFWIL